MNFVEAIGVPQAFSPNGDDNNDILFVKGFGITTMKFVIYNRYGEVVFETTDRDGTWDGTYKGKKLDPDVYDYYLKVTCIDEQVSIVKGNITLIR